MASYLTIEPVSAAFGAVTSWYPDECLTFIKKWNGQTFTVPEGETWTVQKFVFRIQRVGTVNSLDVYLTETTAGLPNAVVLGSITDVDVSTITTDSSGEDVMFTLTSSVELTEGVYSVYVVPHQSWGDVNNYLQFGKVSQIEYSGGNRVSKVAWEGYESAWGNESKHLYLDILVLAPSKPINPTPENEASDVTLDQTTVMWEDGGGATSYNIYQGTTSGNLSLVESGVTDLEYTLRSTNWPNYGQNRYWRVDAVNVHGTTEGDEWYFTTLLFLPPTPDGITWDDPGNSEGYTGTPLGTNNMLTVRRLVVAADDAIFYESA